MYIQQYHRKKKTGVYTTTYIAESYRENGKVKRRHLSNITHLPDELRQAICKTVEEFQNRSFSFDQMSPLQGKSCGALLAFLHLAKQTRVLKALGNSRQGKLALFQIIARIVCQGSRLYSVEWSKTQAVREVLKLKYFDEDDLYNNLDWLCENQEKIEQKLFKLRHKGSIPTIYLYDITSSYLEGAQNELAAYGYNRDKKQGKMQIVIGLLCDDKGYPVSVEVFNGNTTDSTTVIGQVEKLAKRFRVKNVVMVGDRGMIKSKAIEKISSVNWHYITAITKAQIEKLIRKDVFQLELFTDELVEVEDEGIRYVLHRNPIRAEEIQMNRSSKLDHIESLCKDRNQYLQQHPRARIATAQKVLQAKINKLKLTDWVSIDTEEGLLKVIIDDKILSELELLDGCYAIKSNVSDDDAKAEQLHSRYKDLSMVEQAFRTCKQSIEEIRPIYVRKETRTRGHVFVCMLAYILVKQMAELCSSLPLTRKGIISQLNQLQYVLYQEKKVERKILPKQLQPELEEIINRLKLKLPTYL